MSHHSCDGAIDIFQILTPSTYLVRCSNCIKMDDLHHLLQRYLIEPCDGLMNNFQPHVGDVVCVLGLDDSLSRGRIIEVIPRGDKVVQYTVHLVDSFKEITISSDFVLPCESKWKDLEPQAHLIGLYGVAPCEVSYGSAIDPKEVRQKVVEFEDSIKIVEEIIASSEVAVFKSFIWIDRTPYGLISLQKADGTVILNDLLVARQIGLKSETFDIDLITLKYVKLIEESRKSKTENESKAVKKELVQSLSKTVLAQSVGRTTNPSFEEICESVVSSWVEPFGNYMKRLSYNSQQACSEPSINPHEKIVLDIERLLVEPVTLVESVTPEKTSPSKLPVSRKITSVQKCPNSDVLKSEFEARNSRVLIDSDLDNFLSSMTDSSSGLESCRGVGFNRGRGRGWQRSSFEEGELRESTPSVSSASAVGTDDWPGEDAITFCPRGRDILSCLEDSSSGDEQILTKSSASGEMNVASVSLEVSSPSGGRGYFASRGTTSRIKSSSGTRWRSFGRRGGLQMTPSSAEISQSESLDERSLSSEQFEVLASSTIVDRSTELSALPRLPTFPSSGLLGGMQKVPDRTLPVSKVTLDQSAFSDQLERSSNSSGLTLNSGADAQAPSRRSFGKRGGVRPKVCGAPGRIVEKEKENFPEQVNSSSSPPGSNYDNSLTENSTDISSRRDFSNQNALSDQPFIVSPLKHHRSFSKRGGLSRSLNNSSDERSVTYDKSSPCQPQPGESSSLDNSIAGANPSHSLSSIHGSSESLSSRQSDSNNSLTRGLRLEDLERNSGKVIHDIAESVDIWQKQNRGSPSPVSSIGSRASLRSSQSPAAKDEDQGEAPSTASNRISLGGLLLVDHMNARCCLVHGSIKSEPVFILDKLNLDSNIKETAFKKCIKDLLKSQAFSMPIILQRRNLIMVAPASSKRTFSYVIPLLSLMMDDLYYAKMKRSNGPICLIIAPNSHRVKHIGSMCQEYTRGRLSVQMTHGGGLELEKKGELANGCDILVSTPKCWLRLFKTGFVTDTSRLCHLVLDSGGDLLRLFLPEIELILDVIQETVKLRHSDPDIQTIIVEDSWTKQLEKIVFRRIRDPVVMFGSHVEAAIYGRITPKVRIIRPEMKLANITQIVKEAGKVKTVVVCSSVKECNEVFTALHRVRSNVIRVHDETTMKDLNAKRNEWLNGKSDELLICTDSILSEMAITDAHVLIHASLPESKSFFNDRFAVIQDSLPDRIQNPDAPRPNCQIIIVSSKDDELQFPALVDFMVRIPLQVPEEIKIFAEKVKKKKLEENNEPLCPYLLYRGDCINEVMCRKRHAIVADKDKAVNLPTRGFVKCKILHVHNPIKFSVQILASTESGDRHNATWTPWPTRMKEIVSKMDALFTNRRKTGIEKAKIGDVVCVEVEFDVKYMRAKVIDIVKRDDKLNPTVVRVVYLDNGRFGNINVYKLLALPPDLASLPGEAVDICQINFLPVDADTEWSYISRRKVEDEVLPSMSRDDQYVLAEVSCSVAKTIMVRSFGVYELVRKIETRLFDLEAYLLECNLAFRNPEHILKIKALCCEAGIKFEEAVAPPRKKAVAVAEARWAHFPKDPNESTEVLVVNIRSPSQFYCVHSKFFDMLKQLEKDMGQEFASQKAQLFQPFEGCHCAVKSPNGSEWNRAIILESVGEQLNIFYLDYGDSAVIQKSEAFVLPNKFIIKLPFQAVECELAGVKAPEGSWNEQSTDYFYSRVMVKNGELHQWKTLILSVCEIEENAQLTGGHHYKVVLVDPLDALLINEGIVLAHHALWKDRNCFQHLNKWRNELESVKGKEVEEDRLGEEEVERGSRCGSEGFTENVFMGFDLYDDPHSVDDVTSELPPEPRPPAEALKEQPIQDTVLKVENAVEAVKNTPKLINLGVYVPQVIWRQTSDYIFVKFMLTDIGDYGFEWSNNNICFWTNHRGQDYLTDLKLYGSIHGSTVRTNKTGFFLEVKALKVVQGAAWPRLSYLETKCPFIKPDMMCGMDSEEVSLIEMAIQMAEKRGKPLPFGHDPTNAIVPEEEGSDESSSVLSYKSDEEDSGLIEFI